MSEFFSEGSPRKTDALRKPLYTDVLSVAQARARHKEDPAIRWFYVVPCEAWVTVRPDGTAAWEDGEVIP